MLLLTYLWVHVHGLRFSPYVLLFAFFLSLFLALGDNGGDARGVYGVRGFSEFRVSGRVYGK